VRKCAVILYEILEDYLAPVRYPCTLYMMRQTIHAVANVLTCSPSIFSHASTPSCNKPVARSHVIVMHPSVGGHFEGLLRESLCCSDPMRQSSFEHAIEVLSLDCAAAERCAHVALEALSVLLEVFGSLFVQRVRRVRLEEEKL